MKEPKAEDPFEVNDFNSDLNSKKEKKFNFEKKVIIISGVAFLFAILVIVIIILAIKLSGSKSDKKDNRKIIGEINCIYEINSKDKATLILGNEFEKNSEFDIIINEKKIGQYQKEYIFENTGENKIIFELYDDIDMDYMFKDIKALKSIELISKAEAKILSMKNSFENCYSLESFYINGFNTENINSLNKLFYNTSLHNLTFDIDTRNVEDISFIFAMTKLESINLVNNNFTKVSNMSYAFYLCSSLKILKFQITILIILKICHICSKVVNH